MSELGGSVVKGEACVLVVGPENHVHGTGRVVAKE